MTDGSTRPAPACAIGVATLLATREIRVASTAQQNDPDGLSSCMAAGTRVGIASQMSWESNGNFESSR